MGLGSQFLGIYNALPQEGQQVLVENYLAVFLDDPSEDKASLAVSAAQCLQAQYTNMPKIDFKAKRKQVDWLFQQIRHDSKVAFVKERSNRDDLIRECLNTLTNWLGNIWLVVYEHNAQFNIAHTCLLYVSEALAQLVDHASLGGCKCKLFNIPVDVTLQTSDGHVLKMYSVSGPQEVDSILLTIWRDLFVALLATGSKRDKDKIPDMLDDLEDVMGQYCLEKLVFGGNKCSDIDSLSRDYIYMEEDEEDIDEADRCDNLHAMYWPSNFSSAGREFRTIISDRLYTIFKKAPATWIVNTLLEIVPIPFNKSVSSNIDSILQEIAPSTSDTFAAALQIYAQLGMPERLTQLLDTHYHLLRPRDSSVLQVAVLTLLDCPGYGTESLRYAESAFRDTIQNVHNAIRGTFIRIEEDQYVRYLEEQVLKLKQGTATRKEHLEEWAGNVISPPSAGMLHPFAFAAMMMGMPPFPGTDMAGDDEDDESAILGFVNLDQADPDLRELKEEFRPDLKESLEIWIELMHVTQKGRTIASKLYLEFSQKMPWMKAGDVMEEMIKRLVDRASKKYLVEALKILLPFCKTQRKRIHETQKRKAVAEAKLKAIANSTISHDTSPLHKDEKGPKQKEGESKCAPNTSQTAAALNFPASSGTDFPSVSSFLSVSAQSKNRSKGKVVTDEGKRSKMNAREIMTTEFPALTQSDSNTSSRPSFFPMLSARSKLKSLRPAPSKSSSKPSSTTVSTASVSSNPGSLHAHPIFGSTAAGSSSIIYPASTANHVRKADFGAGDQESQDDDEWEGDFENGPESDGDSSDDDEPPPPLIPATALLEPPIGTSTASSSTVANGRPTTLDAAPGSSTTTASASSLSRPTGEPTIMSSPLKVPPSCAGSDQPTRLTAFDTGTRAKDEDETPSQTFPGLFGPATRGDPCIGSTPISPTNLSASTRTGNENKGKGRATDANTGLNEYTRATLAQALRSRPSSSTTHSALFASTSTLVPPAAMTPESIWPLNRPVFGPSLPPGFVRHVRRDPQHIYDEMMESMLRNAPPVSTSIPSRHGAETRHEENVDDGASKEGGGGDDDGDDNDPSPSLFLASLSVGPAQSASLSESSCPSVPPLPVSVASGSNSASASQLHARHNGLDDVD